MELSGTELNCRGASSVAPLAQIIENNKRHCRYYTNDTQIDILISPGDYNPKQVHSDCNGQLKVGAQIILAM